MATIINVRGTGGSGKSYTVFRIMKKLGVKNKILKDSKVVGYRLNGDVMIVGRYETDCGGCDQIKTQDAICDRVAKFAKKGKIVIFEGLLISGSYGIYRDLSRRLRKDGHKYTWMFLDTPLKKCIKQTIERRKKRGNNKPFNEKNTVHKFRAVELSIQHAKDDGETVVVLDHNKAYRQVMNLMK